MIVNGVNAIRGRERERMARRRMREKKMKKTRKRRTIDFVCNIFNSSPSFSSCLSFFLFFSPLSLFFQFSRFRQIKNETCWRFINTITHSLLSSIFQNLSPILSLSSKNSLSLSLSQELFSLSLSLQERIPSFSQVKHDWISSKKIESKKSIHCKSFSL